MDRLLQMSAKELSRLEVMQRVSRKQMSQNEAGRILELSTRQRGHQSSDRLSEEVKKQALN